MIVLPVSTIQPISMLVGRTTIIQQVVIQEAVQEIDTEMVYIQQQ